LGRWRASVARWGDVITHAWFSRRARAGAGWMEGSPRGECGWKLARAPFGAKWRKFSPRDEGSGKRRAMPTRSVVAG
jgi:hypothetical protein